jgi:hypothetical protein
MLLLHHRPFEEPPAGFEPAPRPYDGRVLAADTTEAEQVEMPGVEPDPPRCKRGALPVELHPQGDADGWSRTTTARGSGVTGRRARRVLSVRVKGVAGRIRTGAAGITTPNASRYTTATAGTAGLEPATSRLTSERSGRLSLELMRLARTTAPLPRSGLAGRTRTCDPRLPGPVGWPAPPQPEVQSTLAGLEPAASGFGPRPAVVIAASTTRACKLRRQGSNLRSRG